MIHSSKLQEFFKEYDPDWLHDFLVEIFRVTHTKTYSDCGLYVWLGAEPNDFHNNLTIDRDSPSCWVKQPSWPKSKMDNEDGVILYTFIHHTEDEVIRKFTRYKNLKAFL